MPKASQQVALVDQDGHLQRSISKTEAKKLCSTGERVEICHKCGKHGDALKARAYCGANQRGHLLVYMLTELGKNETRPSNCSITFSEMLANVGLAKKDELNHELSQAYIAMTRDKINAWPTCRDTKAPIKGVPAPLGIEFTPFSGIESSIPEVGHQAVPHYSIEELASAATS